MRQNPASQRAPIASNQHFDAFANAIKEHGSFFSKQRDARSSAPNIYDWGSIHDQFAPTLSLPKCVTFLFVRHGESINNQKKLISGKSNVPLSENGKQQAREIASDLTGQFLDITFCSSLLRARQTMELALRNVPVLFDHAIYDARLDERSLGDLEDTPFKFIPEFSQGDLDFAPNNGESYRQLMQRCLSFLIDTKNIILQTEVTGGANINISVFSHVGPMRVFDAIFSQRHSSKEMMDMDFKNAHILRYDVKEIHLPSFL